MDRCHAGVPHGLPLPRIGPYAVGHDGAAGPQAVFGIGLPVLLAARVELAHPGHLCLVLRQVGLDGEIPLRRQFAQKRHQLVSAGGGEPGRQHGLHQAEVLTGIQPAERLTPGLLCGLLQQAGGSVPVHVHLAHVAGDAGLLQFLHQDQRGVRVERGEHAHPRGAVCNKLPGQAAVNLPGVACVREPGLCGKGVCVQPVQQGQVHAHPQHGVLGRMEVQIRKGLEDQRVSPVLHRGTGVLLGQRPVHTPDEAVLGHQISARQGIQLSQGGSGQNSSLDDRQ